jgi:hypothetical protein
MLYPADSAATKTDPVSQEVTIPIVSEESAAPAQEQLENDSVESTIIKSSQLTKSSHTEEKVASQEDTFSPDVTDDVESTIIKNSQITKSSHTEEKVASQEDTFSPDVTDDTESKAVDATSQNDVANNAPEEVIEEAEDESIDEKPVVVEEDASSRVYTSRNQVLEEAMLNELLKSGLVNDPNNFTLKLTYRVLKINGQRLPKEAQKSLKDLFENTSQRELSAGSYIILEKIDGQSTLDMKITDFE